MGRPSKLHEWLCAWNLDDAVIRVCHVVFVPGTEQHYCGPCIMKTNGLYRDVSEIAQERNALQKHTVLGELNDSTTALDLVTVLCVHG